MDLLDSESILDKANRWLGRATNLKDSAEQFHLWMLIGEPRIEKLRPAYAKALNSDQVNPEGSQDSGANQNRPAFVRDLGCFPGSSRHIKGASRG
jgi:hypothetical protein